MKSTPSHPTAGDRRPSAPGNSVVVLSYVALFALVALPWIRVSDRAIPRGSSWAFPDDARIIVFNMGWVGKALARAPGSILNAPMFHPAPSQLTGCDSFLSSQLVFAPLQWLTGNPVLAASWTSLLSYPIAAFVFFRLATTRGASSMAAWLAGLAFALGPMRVPANLQVIQYPNLFLPLVALTLDRLRRDPSRRNTILFSVAVASGLLASFYMALMVLLTIGLWWASDLRAPSSRSRAFLARCASALVVATGLFVAMTWPWMATSPDGTIAAVDADPIFFRTALMQIVSETGFLVSGLALAGLLLFALGRLSDRQSMLARPGAMLFLVGIVLMLGKSAPLGSIDLPLPFAILQYTPARFFRVPWRFAVVAGFGGALLICATIDAVGSRMGSRSAALFSACLTGALLTGPGRELAAGPLDRIRAESEPIYDDLRRHAVSPDESLLELPLSSPYRMLNSRNGLSTPEALVGVLRHGIPLVNGESRFTPPHDRFIRLTVSNLVAGGNLDDLVDMTHLRWVLLRPVAEWQRGEDRDTVLNHPGFERVWTKDGYDLLRVRRDPRHPEWFRALAHGVRRGHSVLGTPFDVIGDPVARMSISVSSDRPGPDDFLGLRLDLANDGADAWPAGQPGIEGNAVIAKFRIVEASDPFTDSFDGTFVNLWRDVPASESFTMTVPVRGPSKPGTYRVDVALLQLGGKRFASASQELEVVPRAEPGGSAASPDDPSPGTNVGD